jgi:hypothetical protein
MHLLAGYRAVLDPPWNDIHLPRAERHGTIAQVDIERSLEHEKEVVGSSCLCQTNGPFSFTTMTSWPLNRVTVLGAKWSENWLSLSERLMLSAMIASILGR